jgi:hypothetical protein
MRSVALLRVSAAAGSLALVGATLAQVVNLSVVIPVHNLRIAWTLARILIQL